VCLPRSDNEVWAVYNQPKLGGCVLPSLSKIIVGKNQIVEVWNVMESLDNLEAFPMTNHKKEHETPTSLHIRMDDKFKMEVQEQETGSLGEQSIFVVVDNNDPMTNQENQEEIYVEGL
jgi:hypothetical protein